MTRFLSPFLLCWLLVGASPLGAQPALNAAQLLHDVEVLAADSMAGRQVGTPGGARARAYLVAAFAEAGLAPLGEEGFEQPFAFGETWGGGKTAGVNVVGYVGGMEMPDSFLVVTAHYDHLGVQAGKIYNGADDNASGVAVLMAAARHFARHRPRHAILFAALDAEEVGLLGAYALVEKLRADEKKIVLNVNLDMVGRSEAGELYAVGTYQTPTLKPILEKVAAESNIRLLFGHDRPGTGAENWLFSSDHAAFYTAGVPFIYFGVEDHDDYHRPTDDPETLTKDFFTEAARTILAAILAFDAEL